MMLKTPVLAVVVTLCFLEVNLDAQQLRQRMVGPVQNYTAANLENQSPEWIQVKFIEGSDVSLANGLVDANPMQFADAKGLNLEEINVLVEDAIEIQSTFAGDRERFRQYKTIGEARSGTIGPDLGLWFNVRFHGDRAALADKLNALNSSAVIEIAHPVPRVEPATCFVPGTPDFTGLQGYLYDTPLGLDAPAAWALPGGRGAGMKFIDIERNWFRTHEDFDQDNFFFSNNVTNAGVSTNHGTAVLGEVIGVDNGFGVVGFASDAQWGTVAYPTAEWPLVADYFMVAAEALDPGDVWLIEIQMFPAGLGATPMEYLQANYDAIWTSSWALDVVCVEAGANGSQNLDSAAFDNLFDRNFRDSGAILVAAGRPTSLTAESFSNYGSRMDAHAWGSEIVTTGYGDLQNGGLAIQYTADFGGTSGASPMVVGAVLCLQGILKAETGTILNPIDIRQIITDSGTPHTDSNRDIGPRANIAAAIDLLPNPCLIGDVNRDGVVDLLDVQPFVEALLAGKYVCEADLNEDGIVDLLDVSGFINCLGGGNEPCTNGG